MPSQLLGHLFWFWLSMYLLFFSFHHHHHQPLLKMSYPSQFVASFPLRFALNAVGLLLCTDGEPSARCSWWPSIIRMSRNIFLLYMKVNLYMVNVKLYDSLWSLFSYINYISERRNGEIGWVYFLFFLLGGGEEPNWDWDECNSVSS